jgi:hypothetical protein
MTMFANIVMLRGQSRSTVASERRERNRAASATALQSATELMRRLDKTADAHDVPEDDQDRETELRSQIAVTALDFSRKSYRENIGTCCFLLSLPRTRPPNTSLASPQELKERSDADPDPEVWHYVQVQLKTWTPDYLLDCLGAFRRGERRCPRPPISLRYDYQEGRATLRQSDRLAMRLLPDIHSLRIPVNLRITDWIDEWMDKRFPLSESGKSKPHTRTGN